MEEQNGSPLERLNKRLYEPTPTDSFKEPSLSAKPTSLPTGWAPEAPRPIVPQKPKMPLATLFLIGAGVFFLIACGVAAWLIIGGGRSVSTDHITISIQGPTTVAGGDTVPLLVSIKNTNPVAITDTNLMIDFPPGTYSGDQPGTPLSHYADTVGDVPPGATVARTVRATLFGNENQHVTIPITLEYRTQGASAVFQKKTQYEFTIGTSPVGLKVESLSEVSSGQPLTMVVSVRSNAATPLPNVSLVGTYPFGFSVTHADPNPTSGSTFDLGTLAPGEERKVTITGTLTAQDNEQRVFHFDVGTSGDAGGQGSAVIYTSAEVPLTVAKPFLATTLTLNQSATDPLIAQSGQSIQGLLTWENTIASRILNGEITVAFGGTALDPTSISTANGFFRSLDNSILFSSDRDSGLKSLDPGDRGNGSFRFMSKTGAALASLRNPVITLSVSTKGQRTGQTGVPTQENSTITRTIKIATDFLLSSRVVYSTGPFKNTGPWPPKVDQETTYTVLLSASNSVNTVADATAVATLPSYVRFTGQVSGNVTYNENTRTVTWDLGEVPAGVTQQAAFQVAFRPSLSQKSNSPIIVSSQTLTGYDRFVSRQVQSSGPALDIDAKTDPAYQFSFGTVQQ